MHILLEPGDIIREGDEYWSHSECWVKTSTSVGYKVLNDAELIRRHLDPWNAVRHALQSIPDTDATTTQAYWDCECETGHIRYCGHPYCARCGTHRQDQPDSRLREVLLSLLPK